MSSRIRSLLNKLMGLDESKQGSNRDELQNSESEKMVIEEKPVENEKSIENQIDDEFSEFESDSVSSETALSQPIPVYLGIDFGTSFSKLAYWADENNRGDIDIGGKYFINTAVYIDGKSISITRDEEATEIKYFKYEMIPNKGKDDLFSNEMKGAIKELCFGYSSFVDFSRNCSIFFVAYLLKCCDETVRQKFDNYQLFINMGMPIADGVSKQSIFEEILFCAYKLFINGEISEKLEYAYLAGRCDSYHRDFLRSKKETTYPLSVTSEVIAEADFLLHQETYGIGKYVIIDIGGGTADFAFVQKCAGKRFGDYDLIWYSIVPHGIETKKYNTNYSHDLGQSYADFLKDSKLLLNSKGVGGVTYILFGGGSSDYNVRAVLDNISRKFPEVKERFILKPDERAFPEHHQIGHLNLSDSDKKRLVIACQLSYPVRPEVVIMPPTKENLNEIKRYAKTNRNPNGSRPKVKAPDYHSTLEDRQRELYGN